MCTLLKPGDKMIIISTVYHLSDYEISALYINIKEKSCCISPAAHLQDMQKFIFPSFCLYMKGVQSFEKHFVALECMRMFKT